MSVEGLTESDWEWLRALLGDERVGDPDEPDRIEAALALRDAGLPDERVRGWMDVVDAAADGFAAFKDFLLHRIVDLDRRCVAPEHGARWLHDNAPTDLVPSLLSLGRTVDEYHAFLKVAYGSRERLPVEGDQAPEGLFLIRWLLGTNFPVDEALAYALAGVQPEEALETWEPLRQSDHQRWASTLLFMGGMLASPDSEPGVPPDA